MEDFYSPDDAMHIAKGLVFIGQKVLIYRRDTNTKVFPLYLDLPGGVAEMGETPFGTFKREIFEEFGLIISETDIVYTKRYVSGFIEGEFDWFVVAKLDNDRENDIKFGDEGLEYMLMSLDDFITAKDGWPIFQQRSLDYIKH
jgi:8-oxo-dGTP diphosphatase